MLIHLLESPDNLPSILLKTVENINKIIK